MYKIVLVFISALVVNIFWANYIQFAAEKKMLKAAIYGELIMICGAVISYNYIHDLRLLIPAILGGFIGTLYSEKLKKLFKRKK